ncbi:MAG TPA: hypothetical protein VLJ76_07830 [Gaiellaceae bacterium]|nr:hypothetical protein [Gaiellaceae bacterium]
MAGAAAGALGGAGIYELVDRLSPGVSRPPVAAPPAELLAASPEQHLLGGLAVINRNGVEVIVPPLHHMVVTATVRAKTTKELKDARAALEATLVRLEREFPATPSGVGITVAWGLPYFRRRVPKLADRYLPIDLRASKQKGREVRTLIDAVRFPSDPSATILEANEAAVLIRSDHLDHIHTVEKALFTDLDVFRKTSIRRGFVGGGFEGGPGLPKQLATAAGVRGADLIPHGSELFLGFTSTQRAALGPTRIANVETLGYSTGGPGGYFRRGTHMHLSHMSEDLEFWYVNFTYGERVATAFRPGLNPHDGTQTIAQGPKGVGTTTAVRRDYNNMGVIGHSQAIQTTSRLLRDVRGSDGTLYPKGTAIPHRADFNTLDNPFYWTADPNGDNYDPDAAAGLHFVVFNPTSDDFHRNRLAMDGVLPDGTKLKFEQGDRGQGINSVLHVTHRQNLIVPPRVHRSFPLVELLA